MKTKKFALLIILSMLVTGFAGADSYIVEDDIYYNPNDKNPVVEKKEKEAQKELQEKAAVKKTLMATSDKSLSRCQMNIIVVENLPYDA